MPSASLTRLRGEGARMLLLTALSFALGYALTVAGTEWLRLDSRVAYGAAIVVCSVLNFFGCRYFVFAGPHGPLLASAARFLATVLGMRVAEVALFSLLTAWQVHYQLAYVVTSGLSFVVKFLLAKFFVFRGVGSRDGVPPP